MYVECSTYMFVMRNLTLRNFELISIYEKLVNMSANKPWENILIRTWKFLNLGWRKYIFIPLFLIFIITSISSNFYTNISPIKEWILRLVSEQTSYITPDEKDVLDEWVILVHKTNSKEQLDVDFKKLNADYEKSKHEGWSDKLHKVRSPNNSKEWLIVIDAVDGKGSHEEIQAKIKQIKFITIDLPDGQRLMTSLPLTIWTMYATPFEYKKVDFEDTYGKIVN